MTFITQSRKCFTDIIFITQSLKTVDKQLRLQALFVWHFRDLQGLVLPIFSFIKYPLPQILQLQFSNDSQLQKPFKKRFVWKRKAVFRSYNSFELLRQFPRLEQKEAVKKGKTTVSMKDKKLALAGILILLLIFAPKVWSFFTTPKPERKNIQPTKTSRQHVTYKHRKRSQKPRYEIIREQFTAFIKVSQRKIVITEQNEYWKGYYCALGLVKDVTRNRVKVQKPDGSYLIIIDKKKPYRKEGKNAIDSKGDSTGKAS